LIKETAAVLSELLPAAKNHRLIYAGIKTIASVLNLFAYSGKLNEAKLFEKWLMQGGLFSRQFMSLLIY